MPRDGRVDGCDDLRLIRAIQHVKRDLTRRPSLGAVSKVAGLERTYFCKYFRRYFGLSYSEWNTHVRIEEAQRLLAGTRQHVGAIGFAVGYSDVTTFERNFRKLLGVSPRQYRQQNRKAQRSSNTIGCDPRDDEPGAYARKRERHSASLSTESQSSGVAELRATSSRPM